METESVPTTPDAKPAPSKPHFPKPPAGVQPLIDRKLEKALGGRAIPMRVVRPGGAAAKPSPLPGLVAANVSGTFSGAPAGDPALKGKITTARAKLARAILLITELETTLPELLDDIAKDAPGAKATENFDVEEAREFHEALVKALNSIRK